MKFNNVLGCNDISIRIGSNNLNLISDILKAYGSYYNDISDPIYTVNFLENIIPENYNYKDYTDNKKEIYIVSDRNKLNIYFEKYDENVKFFCRRILINCFILKFQENGYVILHGACLSKHNHGIIISGQSGAGKTTTLLNLMKKGYKFISNDKIAVKYENSKLLVCGIPHSMGIIKEDIVKYCLEDVKDKYTFDKKIYFKVIDIPKYFGNEIQNKVVVDTIIFPKYIKNLERLEVSKCNDNFKEFNCGNIFYEEAINPHRRYLINLVSPSLKYESANFINYIDGYLIKQGENTFDMLDQFIVEKVNCEEKKCFRL